MSPKFVLLLVLFSTVYFASYLAQSGEFAYSNADSDYLVINTLKTWDAALAFCKNSKKMALVSFETQTKLVKFNMFLLKNSFVESKNVHPDIEHGFVYWTSGNNRADPNKFIWEGTGKAIDYFHWSNVENSQKDGGCIQVGRDSLGRFSNASCDGEFYFICEKQK